MDSIAIIADDLTGAGDTGVQFCPFFEDTILVSHLKLSGALKPDAQPDSRAIAVYTNSRALTAGNAYQRLESTAQWLARHKFRQIYKKIDSCMRGNVGSETDALLDGLGYEASFITPAFPEMGRTTRQDVHQVHGIALDQTEIAQDPVTPVSESRLTRIVAGQSRHPVGHVGLKFLEGEPQPLVEEIERQLRGGVRHLVFDVTGRAHLDRIAQLLISLERKILPVGSAGLAGSIAKQLPLRRASDRPAKIITPRVFNLLVCGSASAVSGQQIETLLANRPYEVIELNPMLLADQQRLSEFLQTASRTRAALTKNNVILSIKSRPTVKSPCRSTASQPSADAIVRGVGRFVAAVVADTRPAHLFLTGGDTADAVLTAIAADGVRILGEVVAGVVHGVLIGGLLDGLPLVTKAGAFGQQDTLVAVHEFWLAK